MHRLSRGLFKRKAQEDPWMPLIGCSACLHGIAASVPGLGTDKRLWWIYGNGMRLFANCQSATSWVRQINSCTQLQFHFMQFRWQKQLHRSKSPLRISPSSLCWILTLGDSLNVNVNGFLYANFGKDCALHTNVSFCSVRQIWPICSNRSNCAWRDLAPQQRAGCPPLQLVLCMKVSFHAKASEASRVLWAHPSLLPIGLKSGHSGNSQLRCNSISSSQPICFWVSQSGPPPLYSW